MTITTTPDSRPGSIVLMAHPEVMVAQPRVDEAVKAVVEAARAAGISVFAGEADLAEATGLDAMTSAADADLCIALGGDGTILRSLRAFGTHDVPVFGLNYGVVGFLAAAEPDELETAIKAALAGEYESTALPSLVVNFDGVESIALNDVSFTRRPHDRVADLSYRLGGKEVGHVRCDGLVAATPTGSTGYNLANGGPILAWGVQGFVVSFIAPHTLTARALVVAPDDVLSVRNEADRDSVIIGCDGEAIGELVPGAELDVSFRPSAAWLAQLPGENFYLRIREKFGRLAR